jgi:hypothetical protein
MSFSSGAYVGSHSTESRGRAASALRLALLVWIGPLSSTSTTRPALATRRRAVGPVEPHQRGDGIGGALGPAHADDQLASGVVEHAEERALLRPTRRFDPEVRTALRPAVGQVGVGQRLGLVPEQEVDVARRGLLLRQPEAQARALDRVPVLASLERVPRPPPAVAPLYGALPVKGNRQVVRFSLMLRGLGRG